MANRKERRAKERQSRRGIPSQYDDTKGRARSGMIDEYALQDRSRRLAEHKDGEWKPSSSVTSQEDKFNRNILRAEAGDETWNKVRKVISIVSWAVILISAFALFVFMWLPNTPIALTIISSVLFALGVVGLFFTIGNARRNPRLDEHGTSL